MFWVDAQFFFCPLIPAVIRTHFGWFGLCMGIQVGR
jgi:hypothetical protein